MNTYIAGLSERASKLIYTCIFWAEWASEQVNLHMSDWPIRASEHAEICKFIPTQMSERASWYKPLYSKKANIYMDNWIYMDLNEQVSRPMNTYITGLSEQASINLHILGWMSEQAENGWMSKWAPGAPGAPGAPRAQRAALVRLLHFDPKFFN